MNEILQGIRVIKFYAWEKNFEEKIDNLRFVCFSENFLRSLSKNFTHHIIGNEDLFQPDLVLQISKTKSWICGGSDCYFCVI